MSKIKSAFKISIPSIKGFYGRECANSDCLKYFKVHKEFLSDKMYCPYCGDLFSKDDLITKDQINFATEIAIEKVTKNLFDEFDKSTSSLDSKFSKPISYKPNAKANYDKNKVDSELECTSCNFIFQVYGIFGFCPGCRTENIKIYDSNFLIIKNEIKNSQNKQRSLRHAYNDIISSFEIFCKKAAKKLTNDSTNFQNIYDSRKFFKKCKNVDILDGLTNDELLIIRRIFQKRNSYQHYDGIIEEQYIRRIPEDKNLIGQKAVLSETEFENGANILRIMIDKLI